MVQRDIFDCKDDQEMNLVFIFDPQRKNRAAERNIRR